MKKLFVLSLAALTLFACQKNEAPVQNVPGSPVRFTASMQNTFEFKSVSVESLNGKKVRIAADATLEGATSVATVEGTALTLATPIHWMENQTDPTTFVGIYQKVESGDAADAPADLKVTYEMLTDNYYNYEYHEAYLTATAAEVQPEATANLVFKHPFSKVVVNVTNETENTLEGVVLRDVVLSGTLLL